MQRGAGQRPIALLLALVVALPLAAARRTVPQIHAIARTLTLDAWNVRTDELLAARGTIAGAPATWKCGDPHFEAAKRVFLDRFEHRLDAMDITGIVEATLGRSGVNVDTPVSENVTMYADRVFITAEVMRRMKATNPLDPAVRRRTADLQKAAGVPELPESAELARAYSANRQYVQARSAAITSAMTEMNGGLHLYFHDAQETFARDADAQISACRTGHGQ